jgi:hypothetical protein
MKKRAILITAVALIAAFMIAIPLTRERPGPDPPPIVFFTIKNLLSLLF